MTDKKVADLEGTTHEVAINQIGDAYIRIEKVYNILRMGYDRLTESDMDRIVSDMDKARLNLHRVWYTIWCEEQER